MAAALGWQGPTAERLRLAAEVKRLRERGLTHDRIGRLLGISRSYASELARDPTGEQARARKNSYAQPCVECGGPTSGSEGRRKEPRCPRCAAVKSNQERAIWTPERIVAAIRWWADLYGEPPAIPDFNPNQADAIRDYARADRAERHISAGEIPWSTHVFQRFGSWNAGLVAAGFPPRPRGGGQGNEIRRRRRARA